MNLDQLNGLGQEAAGELFRSCCTAERWIEAMVAARPFADEDSLLLTASEIWATMEEPDLLQAFEGHPKIGDVSSLRKKYQNTAALAAGEQASVQQASEDTLERLAQGNEVYEQRFGFIFIVCASGKSAAEMLALLEARVDNSRERELVNAAAEQEKITAIRLRKLP